MIYLSQLSPVYIMAAFNTYFSMYPVLFSSKLLKVSFNFFMGEFYLLSCDFYCNELIFSINFLLLQHLYFVSQPIFQSNHMIFRSSLAFIKRADLIIYLVIIMIKKVIEQSICRNCCRLIEPQKLQLHYMMCRSMPLRKSRASILINKKLEQCMFCMQQFQQAQFDYHVNLSCKHRLVPCIECDDMFPLSLFTEHLQVCRGRTQNKKQENEKQNSTAFQNLIAGLGILGSTLYSKGSEALTYCNKIIEENRAPALQYLQIAKTRISDTFQDIFMSLAYQQNVEGMPREEIRKIPMSNYRGKNNGQQQNCIICFCELQEEEVIKQLKCKHFYHPTCIEKWLRINRTCPLCKKDQMEE